MWSIAVRSRLWIVSLLMLLPLSVYSVTTPIVPKDPVSPGQQNKDSKTTKKDKGLKGLFSQDPKIKDVKFKTNTLTNKVMLKLYRLRLEVYGGRTLNVTWKPKYTSLTVTNKKNKTITIRTLALEDIRTLSITHWKPVAKGTGNYQFQPDAIKIILKDRSVYKTSSLPLIHTLLIRHKSRVKKAYTIFYDRWIKGQTGVYRWKNSRAGSFAYNFSHPLEGVVTQIDFIDLSLKPEDK